MQTTQSGQAALLALAASAILSFIDNFVAAAFSVFYLGIILVSTTNVVNATDRFLVTFTATEFSFATLAFLALIRIVGGYFVARGKPGGGERVFSSVNTRGRG